MEMQDVFTVAKLRELRRLREVSEYFDRLAQTPQASAGACVALLEMREKVQGQIAQLEAELREESKLQGGQSVKQEQIEAARSEVARVRERDAFIADIAAEKLVVEEEIMDNHSECQIGCCEALSAFIRRARALRDKEGGK